METAEKQHNQPETFMLKEKITSSLNIRHIQRRKTQVGKEMKKKTR